MRPSLKSHRRLRWAARITPMAAVVLALIYSFVLCFAVNGAGTLVWGTFALSAMFVGLAIVAWEWSLVGGLFVVVVGGWALSSVLHTNYDLRFEAVFVAFCSIYILGGLLHLVRGYLIHFYRRKG